MLTKTYNLKKGAFTVDHPELADVDECVLLLTAVEKLALCKMAFSQWAYRTAATEENDGRHFTFAEAIADMATVGEGRSTGPSKKDKADAERWWAGEWKLVCASNPNPKHDPKADDAEKEKFAEAKSAVTKARHAAMSERVADKIQRNLAKLPDLAFEIQESWTELESIENLYRAVRLYGERSKPTAV